MNNNEQPSHRNENPATPKIICAILTVITLGTIILGFYLKNPFIIIVGIFPAAIYEAIRTEGYYTKAGSIIILLAVIFEILALKGIIKFNLANFFNRETMYFSGYFITLGEISIIFPALAAIISIVLFFRTYGIYTKWLAILLLVSSIALLYLVNKEGLIDLIRTQNYMFY